jgi:acyl-CoA thioester hydrolase
MARYVPRRSDYQYFKALQTRWIDNDIYGHMNNALYYQFFDTAVNGWLLETGLLDLRQSETIFVVAETGCSYFSEMGFPDTIHAGLKIVKIGTSSITYEVGLFQNENEHASALGKFVHVHVDRTEHRPTPLTDVQREKMACLLT